MRLYDHYGNGFICGRTDDRDKLAARPIFGAHSDQERISEESVYKHLQFYWKAVTAIAGAKF